MSEKEIENIRNNYPEGSLLEIIYNSTYIHDFVILEGWKKESGNQALSMTNHNTLRKTVEKNIVIFDDVESAIEKIKKKLWDRIRIINDKHIYNVVSGMECPACIEERTIYWFMEMLGLESVAKKNE